MLSFAQREFQKALKQALSKDGYHFKIKSGDEFVLFARRLEYSVPGMKKEELKLDLFHVEGGRLRHAAFMDRTNFEDTGNHNKWAESRNSIPWEISDRAPDHFKEAEMAGMAREEASFVSQDYSAHAGGHFKGIASFLRSFQDDYSREKGIGLAVFHGLSREGEAFIRGFYTKANARTEDASHEILSLFVNLATAVPCKPEIERVRA